MGFRAYPVYLGIKGASALFFMLWATVASVYRIEEVGLDPLRLVLLGTALEVAILVFEVPTGVLADTYGRRRSVITRSEEHTSELQSRQYLVCRLLLEKKKKHTIHT